MSITRERAKDLGWAAHRNGIEYDHRLDKKFLRLLPPEYHARETRAGLVDAWRQGWAERSVRPTLPEVT